MRKCFVSLDELSSKLMIVAAIVMAYATITFIVNAVRIFIFKDPSSDTLIYVGAVFVGTSLVTAALSEAIIESICYIILWTTHVRCKIDRRHAQQHAQ